MKKTKALWAIFIALLIIILTIILIVVLLSPFVRFKTKNIVRNKNQLTYVLQPGDIKNNKNRSQDFELDKLYTLKFGKNYEVSGEKLIENKFKFDLLKEKYKIIIHGIIYTKEYDLEIDLSNFLRIKTDDENNPFVIIPKSEVTVERLKAELPNFDNFFWYKDQNKINQVKDYTNIDFDFLYGFSKKNFTNTYKVEHHYENLGFGYLHTFEMIKGVLGDNVTATIRDVEGFIFDETNANNILTGVVNQEDSLVLKRYYKRNRYNVKFNLNGGFGPSITDIIGVKHGATIDHPSHTPYKPGYKFKFFALNGEKYEFTNFVTSNMVLEAVYETLKDTVYHVEHHFENIKDNNFTEETFVLQGETGTTVQAVKESREGFDFDNTNPLNLLQGVITGDGSLVLKVYYTRKRYNVTFNVNGGTPEIPAISGVKHGDTIEQPSQIPTKIGYTFNKFTLEDNDVEYKFTEPITKEITLVARYDANLDTVYYIDNYFENIHNDEFTVEREVMQGETGTTIKITHKSREGFTFDNQNGSNVLEGIINPSEPLELKLYYKRNRYNVTFNVNGGTPEIPAINNVKHGELIDQPTIPTLNGYLFKHFEFEGVEFKFTTPVTKKMELKAIWEAATNTPYKVIHYYEHINDDDYTSVQEILQGVTGTNVLAQQKNVLGLTFDDTNPNNVKEGLIAADGSLVLKMYYKRNKYNVIFDLNGGVGPTITNKKVKHGQLVAEPTEVPVKVGYTFANYNEGSEEFLFTTPITKETTLVAVYTPNSSTKYTLEKYFEKIEDDTYEKEMLIFHGETDSVVNIAPENRVGFTFDNANPSNVTSGNILPDGSLVLKMYYKRNRYNVTFNLDGGTQPAITDLVVKHGQLVDEPAVEPTKQGYTFKEYDDGTGKFLFITPITKHTNLIAKYIANNDTKYTLEKYFEKLDDENYEKEILTLQGTTGQNIVAEIEVREGFTFDAENALNIKEGIIKADESLVLKLYYKRNRYNVKFDLQGLIETNPVTQNLKHGKLATQPNIASTINGGILKGWSTKGGQRDIVAEDMFDFTQPIEKDLTLFVIYEHVFTEDKYPQTLVSDDALKQILDTRVPFVVEVKSTFHNGNFYGIEKIEYVLNENNFYEKFNGKYFEYKPIEWQTNGTISWSKYILDHQPYSVFIRQSNNPSQVVDTNDWETSYISKFLRNAVSVRTIRNDFRLFTRNELNNSANFANAEARIAASTDFAVERSKVLGNRKFNTNIDFESFPVADKYWTMSPTMPPLAQSHAWYVTHKGILSLESAGVNRGFGVRFVKDNN